MHRIKSRAHTSAGRLGFNPWRTENDAPVESNGNGNAHDTPEAGEPEKSTTKKPIMRQIWTNTRKILFHSWLNVLLIFVPAGIAVHFAGINDSAVFALNAVAVIPLAGLLTFATESVAHRMGPTLGALINVSFGNAVELIIFIIALVKNEIRVVQAALIGSILANLLLILGMALVVGGLQYQEQIYDSLVTQMSAALLAMAVLSLLIPTAFHASFDDLDKADEAVLKLSRGTSVILLLTYLLYLAFQLKSHAYLYRGTPQHLIDAQTTPGPGPGILARMNSSSSSSTSISTISSAGSKRRVRKKLRISKLGRPRKEVKIEEPESAAETPIEPKEEPTALTEKGKEPATSPRRAATAPTSGNTPTRPKMGFSQISFMPPVFRSDSSAGSGDKYPMRRLRSEGRIPGRSNLTSSPLALSPRNSSLAHNDAAKELSIPPPEEEEAELSQVTAIILLLISTALVALCAEFMVGSIDHLVANATISEAFIGLIILPIVGNAAEHVTAVTVAAKNKLDLSLGVSLGSSIQIALFVTPLVVILGWILDKNMPLYFNLFETVTIFVATFVVNFLVLDGRSNYLEGALLCACYVIIAVGAFLFPNSEDQNRGTSGPGTTG